MIRQEVNKDIQGKSPRKQPGRGRTVSRQEVIDALRACLPALEEDGPAVPPSYQPQDADGPEIYEFSKMRANAKKYEDALKQYRAWLDCISERGSKTNGRIVMVDYLKPGSSEEGRLWVVFDERDWELLSCLSKETITRNSGTVHGRSIMLIGSGAKLVAKAITEQFRTGAVIETTTRVKILDSL